MLKVTKPGKRFLISISPKEQPDAGLARAPHEPLRWRMIGGVVLLWVVAIVLAVIALTRNLHSPTSQRPGSALRHRRTISVTQRQPRDGLDGRRAAIWLRHPYADGVRARRTSR